MYLTNRRVPVQIFPDSCQEEQGIACESTISRYSEPSAMQGKYFRYVCKIFPVILELYFMDLSRTPLPKSQLILLSGIPDQDQGDTRQDSLPG
jgi:hypothetical protein